MHSLCEIPQVYNNCYNTKLYKIVKKKKTGCKLVGGCKIISHTDMFTHILKQFFEHLSDYELTYAIFFSKEDRKILCVI